MPQEKLINPCIGCEDKRLRCILFGCNRYNAFYEALEEQVRLNEEKRLNQNRTCRGRIYCSVCYFDAADKTYRCGEDVKRNKPASIIEEDVTICPYPERFGLSLPK